MHFGWAIAAALVVLAGCRTVQPEPPAHRISVADAQAIDRLFAPFDKPGVPGAAVLILDRGRVTFTRGYGLADLETKMPVTERTNFRLASLTKPFTAMAVMLLVEDGRLRLDDRVREILPDFPPYGADVRIRHLLTHTSGLRAYQDFVPKSSTRHVKDRDVLALLGKTDALMFRPGTAFRYGDSGYAILALVVETVSGQPFARFLHDRIFAPLGMETTLVWEPAGPAIPNRALGYAATSSGFRLADHSNTSTVLGDGGIYSSVRDLTVWDRALDAHALVGARMQRLAWTAAELDDRTKTRYGFGWFIDQDPAGTLVFHRGDTSGFSNFIMKYPDEKLTVVVLTNRRGVAADELAATIAALPSLRMARR